VYDWCDQNQTGWVYRSVEIAMELPFYDEVNEYEPADDFALAAQS
jgi:hypothetical protein